MRLLLIATALALLLPACAYAQKSEYTECHSLEAAGNFVGADEVLVDGQVCKVGKPKANRAVPAAPAKAPEKSMALLGVVEPEILRSKENAASKPAEAAAVSRTTSVPQPSGSTITEMAQPPGFEAVASESLGDIARRYRTASGTPGKGKEEVASEPKKPDEKVASVVTPPVTPLAPAVISKTRPVGKTDVSVVPAAPQVSRKPEVASAAPAPAAPVENMQASKSQGATAPQGQSGVTDVAPKVNTGAALSAAVPANATAEVETSVRAAAEVPATPADATSRPALDTVSPSPPQATPAPSEAAPTTNVTQEIPVLEPGPERERGVKTGEFVVPEAPALASKQPQPLVDSEADASEFKEGQLPGCNKNISIGSMDGDRLFLAIPDWALQWYSKNQKRFPGICFSNSLMEGARNYLVVFYTTAPSVPTAEPGSPAKMSSAKASIAPATAERTSANETGTFTTHYGGTWHYTYERTVTTTVSSVSAEKAPHNRQAPVTNVTAYSQEGIPISQRWPTPLTAKDKEPPKKAGKNHEQVSPAFHVMADLLGQAVEDIAKL